VTYRRNRNAVQAQTAGTSIAATLYEAAGPASQVSGANSSESPGTDVAQTRLIPSGA
jgi:hypothetical protein